MQKKGLFIVSPHNWYDHVVPNKINRPLKLTEQLSHNTRFQFVFLVCRVKPNRIININKGSRRLLFRGLIFNLFQDNKTKIYYLEHCIPFGKSEEFILPQILKKLTSYYTIEKYYLWIFDPKSTYLSKRLKCKSLFDAYDDWSISPLFQENRRHYNSILLGYKNAEKYVDVITVNSSFMKRKFKSRNNVYLIANTSSLNEIENDENTKTISNNLNFEGKRKIVGYIGNIHERINLNILEKLVASHKDKDFIFIGKNDYKTDAFSKFISKYENIKHYNPIPYELVYEAILKFDVCIVPHKVNEYTLSQDSMKIYDFLALGKPVVTSNIPPADILEHLLYVSNSAKSFIENIDKAIMENTKEKIEIRKSFIIEHSWSSKVNAMLTLTEDID
jgi:hypothetical protein